MGELILDNLTKQYGDNTVVDRVSLRVREGELLTIVGPSGCGKTTILRMIAGLTEPTGGTISMDGRLLADPLNGFRSVEPEERNFGMVFQSYAVWPHMNVYENVAYPLKLRKKDKATIEKEVMSTLKLVRLDGYERRMAYELSGGQQQRVALARALVMRPRILLLDEPLSNLDAALREEMRGEIKSIQHTLGITVINVTHDQVEAMTLSDQVAVMKNGVLVQFGTPRELYEKPVNSFAAKFIGSANIIPARIDEGSLSDEGKTAEAVINGTYRVPVLYRNEGSTEGFLSVRADRVYADEGSDGIRAEVKRSLYQGSNTEYHLEADGGFALRMLASSDTDYHIGDFLNVKIEKAVWLND